MIEKLLEPFSFNFAQLQDISTFLKQLKKNNISPSDFIKFVEEKKAEKAKIDRRTKEYLKKSKELWEKNALKCPECKIVMNLYSVNTNPRNQVGDNLRSQWICPKCWYEIFSEKTIQDWIKQINRESVH